MSKILNSWESDLCARSVVLVQFVKLGGLHLVESLLAVYLLKALDILLGLLVV